MTLLVRRTAVIQQLDKEAYLSYRFLTDFNLFVGDERWQHAPRPKRRQLGFTLVELSTVLVVIAILAAAALYRLVPLQADAERVAVESVVGSLRSALGMKVASYIARDNMQGVKVLMGSNPMDLLTELPGHYRGVMSAADGAAIEGGEWYFDRQRGELAYRVRNTGVFDGGGAFPAEARFAIVPVYDDRNRNGRLDAGDALHGVRLAKVAPYRWAIE